MLVGHDEISVLSCFTMFTLGCYTIKAVLLLFILRLLISFYGL